MRILITGADGQLGKALRKQIREGVELIPAGIDMCDVTDRDMVYALFNKLKPDAVIHCAAYTAVDQAEKETEICYEVNVNGTENVARACERYHSALMLLSTDYVFDGMSNFPYETDDERRALNVYGKTKIAAEDIAAKVSEHYIIRTSWMFGDGQNFVRTVAQLGRPTGSLQVVDDQVGSPTYSEDLAPVLLDLIAGGKTGKYHITNEGFCSWADLAEECFSLLGLHVRVNRVSTEQFNSVARRPLNSRLSKKSLDRAGIVRLPHWKDAIGRYIQKYGDDL